VQLICSDVRRVAEDSGGRLVVLPVSLLAQWEEEVRTKAPHLKAFTYNGENVNDFHASFRGELTEGLSRYDVVLTTMTKLSELTSNRGNARGQVKNCLGKVKWFRLIVDECQFLKNDTTAIARAASAISATHVWMLSGTPLTNKLDDLRGELSLLRVWPFKLGTSSDQEWRDHFWTEYIKKSWDSRTGQSLPSFTN
jgi:SNF2 family DNA or RNA helicase